MNENVRVIIETELVEYGLSPADRREASKWIVYALRNWLREEPLAESSSKS